MDKLIKLTRITSISVWTKYSVRFRIYPLSSKVRRRIEERYA